MDMSSSTTKTQPEHDKPDRSETVRAHLPQMLHVAARMGVWIVIGAVLVSLLELLGFDAIDWLKRVWENIRTVSVWSIILALVFATLGKLLSSVPWMAALRASYPESEIPYKTILASNQAASLINTFAPAKAGSVLRLGIMRLAIPGSSLSTIIAVSALTSLVFGVISAVTFVILLVSQRSVLSAEANREGTVTQWIREHPALTIAIVAGIVLAVVISYRRFRPDLEKIKQQLLLGGAIVRTPGRFTLLVLLPSLLSYLTRYAQTAVFMDAFGIPVTIHSLFLVIAGRQFSGAIAITPGGIGTKQAVDVLALRRYVSSDVATSFSLAQDAVTKAWNVIFGIMAMSWGFGISGARDIWSDRDKYLSAGRDSGSGAAPPANTE